MNIFHAEKVHDAVVKTTKATAIASAAVSYTHPTLPTTEAV